MKIKQNRKIRAGDTIRFDTNYSTIKILDNGCISSEFGGLIYKALVYSSDDVYTGDYLIGDEEQPCSKRRRLKYIIESEIANYPKKEII